MKIYIISWSNPPAVYYETSHCSFEISSFTWPESYREFAFVKVSLLYLCRQLVVRKSSLMSLSCEFLKNKIISRELFTQGMQLRHQRVACHLCNVAQAICCLYTLPLELPLLGKNILWTIVWSNLSQISSLTFLWNSAGISKKVANLPIYYDLYHLSAAL